MKNVVINADDMGMSVGNNEAIAQAFKSGILTSASVIVNMPAYEDAVKNIIPNNLDLGIGIHLSITEGKSISSQSEIPILVDKYGYFKNSFMKICFKIKKNKNMIHQIKNEIRAQFEKVYSDGIRIDHVNGHHHIHMIPPIFDIVVEMAREYNCRVIRLADERFIFFQNGGYLDYYFPPLKNGNIAKKALLSIFARFNKKYLKDMQASNYFFGVLHSGYMDTRILQYILRCVKSGVTEIITHPSLYDHAEIDKPCNERMQKWLQSDGRKAELEALLSRTIQHEIVKNNIRLVRFRDIA